MLRDACALAVGGVIIGSAAAALLGRLVTGMLYGTAPTDAATDVTVAAVLAGVSAVASLLPAYRAARVDRLAALRSD